MSVLIINQGWTDNLGDIAINRVLEEELAKFGSMSLPFAPIKAKVVRNPISKCFELLKLDFQYRKWITEQLSHIIEPINAAVIGGGELLATNMNFNSAMLCWVKALCKRGIPVYLWGVSGSYTNFLYRVRYKCALRKANKICVRDKKTQKLVYDCYGREAELYPDVVFTYGANALSGAKTKKRNSILCNVLSYEHYLNSGGTYSKDAYFRAWQALLDAEITPDTQIIFGSTTIEDRKTTVDFAEYINNSAASISFPETLEDFWQQLESIECVISGRMHAMILAMQRDCRCTPFVWKEKIEVFRKEYIDTQADIQSTYIEAKCGIDVLKGLILGELNP